MKDLHSAIVQSALQCDPIHPHIYTPMVEAAMQSKFLDFIRCKKT